MTDTPALSDIIGGETMISPRLTLRPLQRRDAEALRAITDDVAITGAISFLEAPFTLSDAKMLIAQNSNGRDCFLGVWRLADECLIGVVGAHLQESGEIEIGYWVAPACWGQGYAGEAAGALVARLGTVFEQPRIVAECRPDNPASWRVLEKLGFSPTGAAGQRPGRMLLAYRGQGGAGRQVTRSRRPSRRLLSRHPRGGAA